MKKFILMLATVVGLIGVFATSVLAHDYFGNAAIDENGKQVYMNSDNEPVNSAVIDREQSIVYEELLKAQVQNSSNGNAADDAQNSMTDEEKAILNAKAEKVTPNCKMKCSVCGANTFKAGICVRKRGEN